MKCERFGEAKRRDKNINKLCLTQREEKRERRWIVKKKHLRASNLTKLNTRIEEEVKKKNEQ